MCFLVSAVDSTPPDIVGGPNSIMETVPLGSSSGVVDWTEPTATDNSGGEVTVVRSHQPGDTFPVGTTQVIYIFTDQAGNSATYTFPVTGNSCHWYFCSKFSATRICL